MDMICLQFRCKSFGREDSDQIIFLNGVTFQCHHSLVRSIPWAMFFYGLASIQKLDGLCPDNVTMR